MRKLSVEDIVKNNENCYSFVVSVAKRARQITDQANDEGVVLNENPVQTAIKEFVGGKFRIEQKGSEEISDEQNTENIEKEELDENTEPADISEETEKKTDEEVKDDGEQDK
jgi:DNA-directed RNA polymerase subunit omega